MLCCAPPRITAHRGGGRQVRKVIDGGQRPHLIYIPFSTCPFIFTLLYFSCLLHCLLKTQTCHVAFIYIHLFVSTHLFPFPWWRLSFSPVLVRCFERTNETGLFFSSFFLLFTYFSFLTAPPTPPSVLCGTLYAVFLPLALRFFTPPHFFSEVLSSSGSSSTVVSFLFLF